MSDGQAFFREAESEALSRVSEEKGVLLGVTGYGKGACRRGRDPLDMLMKWRGPEGGEQCESSTPYPGDFL